MNTKEKLCNNGQTWKSYYWLFLTNGLIGKQGAAEEIANDIWKIFYRDVFLGYFNESELRNKEKSIKVRN